MNSLSPEAVETLRRLLAVDVSQQVKDGKGGEPMPSAWIELYNLTIGL